MIPAPVLAKLEEMADKEYLDASMALRRRFQDAFMSGACTAWELREGEIGIQEQKWNRRYQAMQEEFHERVVDAVQTERERIRKIVCECGGICSLDFDVILNPKESAHEPR